MGSVRPADAAWQAPVLQVVAVGTLQLYHLLKNYHVRVLKWLNDMLCYFTVRGAPWRGPARPRRFVRRMCEFKYRF
jgi:hypothetical protein